MEEKHIPVINKSGDIIPSGKLIYCEPQKHVYLFKQYRKCKWYHKILMLKIVHIGVVKDVDTSTFIYTQK